MAAVAAAAAALVPRVGRFDGVWFVLLDGIFLDYLTLRLKMMMKLLIPYRNFPDQFVKYTRCDVT